MQFTKWGLQDVKVGSMGKGAAIFRDLSLRIIAKNNDKGNLKYRSPGPSPGKF